MFLLENLRRISSEKFIIYRDQSIEKFYKFEDIINAAEEILSEFDRSGLMKNCGIGIRMKNNWVSVPCCIFILSILNYNCFFRPLDHTNELYDISERGLQYYISDEKSFKCDILHTEIKLFEETFYIYRVKCRNLLPTSNWCYSIGTTGTTGTPKIIYVPYNCIASNILCLCEKLKISSNDVIVLCSPLTFDPFIVEFFIALHKGAKLLITSHEVRQSPQNLYRVLFPKDCVGNQASILQITPALFRTFGIDVIQNIILNSSLRVLILGGESFPSRSELQKWLPTKPTPNCRIFNIYGITEISCWSTIYEYNPISMQEDEDMVDIPIGEAINNDLELVIVETNGKVLNGPGEGELEIGSVERKCYIPQIDKHDFTQSNSTLYRKTGDFVKRSQAGHIYYLGRLHNTFKRYGKLLSLDTVSKKIQKAVKRNVVCLWSKGKQKLVCCIQCASLTENNICSKGFLRNLENHEKPDSIVIIAEFPVNCHGKIDRKKLLENIENSNSNNCKHPVNIFEDFLKNVLGLELIYNLENLEPATKRQKSVFYLSFLDAGGTSFQALSLSTEINEHLESFGDQRVFLEMLLNSKESLINIFHHLKKATLKLVNTSQSISSNYENLESKLKLIWRVDFSKCIDSSPVCIAEKYICVGSHSHYLKTVNAMTGELVMQLNLPDRIECTIEKIKGNENLAFVGCYDGYLYAFNIQNGEIIWNFDVGGMIKAKPLYVEDKNCVIVGCYAADHNLWCINTKTHNSIWQKRLGTKAIFASPLMCSIESTIIICTLDGIYSLLDSTNGSVKWIRKLESPIFSTPKFVKNEMCLVIAEVNGKVHICSTNDGKIFQTFKAAGNIFSSITGIDDLLIFGCHDHCVYCLKLSNEERSNHFRLFWKSKLQSPIFTTPQIVRRDNSFAVITISTKGAIKLLDLNNGRILMSYDLENHVYSTPCLLNNDKMYVGCRNNYLYCLQI